MENRNLPVSIFRIITSTKPDAIANIAGSYQFPGIAGRLMFWQTRYGVIVSTEIYGLPRGDTSACNHPIFALHIHEGTSCGGTEESPFEEAGGHYNPNRCAHPFHAGDLPPLFSNNGMAWSAVLTDRFVVDEVLNRVVIIHKDLDDFTTQPSGKSGSKIACGIIKINNLKQPREII